MCFSEWDISRNMPGICNELSHDVLILSSSLTHFYAYIHTFFFSSPSSLFYHSSKYLLFPFPTYETTNQRIFKNVLFPWLSNNWKNYANFNDCRKSVLYKTINKESIRNWEDTLWEINRKEIAVFHLDFL